MLRIEIIHGSVGNIQNLQQFQHCWKRIRDVLVGLQFNDMVSFDSLETCPLEICLLGKEMAQLNQVVSNF